MGLLSYATLTSGKLLGVKGLLAAAKLKSAIVLPVSPGMHRRCGAEGRAKEEPLWQMLVRRSADARSEARAHAWLCSGRFSMMYVPSLVRVY